MIKAKYEEDVKFRKLCSNCQREMSVTILWGIAGFEIRLCEDCSNAIAQLHYVSMTESCDCIYHEDQIWKALNYPILSYPKGNSIKYDTDNPIPVDKEYEVDKYN